MDPYSVTVLALLGVCVMVLGVASAVAATRSLMRPEPFRCPFLRCNVQVSFEEWAGQRFDVRVCSAFRSAAEIDCGKRCLELDRLPSTTV
jgi:hypothetical protein